MSLPFILPPWMPRQSGVPLRKGLVISAFWRLSSRLCPMISKLPGAIRALWFQKPRVGYSCEGKGWHCGQGSNNSANEGGNRNEAKRPHCGARADTAASTAANCGMFYLKNPHKGNRRVFPPNLPQKLCVNFTRKGKFCTSEDEDCPFSHPRIASEPQEVTVKAIFNHFSTGNGGWFNRYHLLS